MNLDQSTGNQGDRDLSRFEADHERALRRIRSEARRGVEEVESITAELANSSRDLVDALVDSGMDGREVTAELPGGSIIGRVVHAGESLVTIESRGGVKLMVVVAHLAGVRLSSEGGPSVRVERDHPLSLEAELRARQASRTPCEVKRSVGGSVAGLVDGVSDTHLHLVDSSGATWLIPLGVITALL